MDAVSHLGVAAIEHRCEEVVEQLDTFGRYASLGESSLEGLAGDRMEAQIAARGRGELGHGFREGHQARARDLVDLA